MNDRAAFRSAAALTVVLVLVGLSVLVLQDPGRFRSVMDFGQAQAQTDRDPVAAAPPAPVPTIDAARPFAGSPAADWPAGIAGLKLPAAGAVGNFSAAKVARALDFTKRYIAATRLDPKVIAGQYPTGVFALIDPANTELRNDLAEALRRPGPDKDPVTHLTRLDPRRDVLHGSIIKVNGTVTVRERLAGELVVTTDALIVYAVRGVAPPSEVTRLVLREQLELVSFARYIPLETLALVRGQVIWSGASCTAPDGYLHPVYPSKWRTADGTETDPYDTSRPIDDGSNEPCGSISRI